MNKIRYKHFTLARQLPYDVNPRKTFSIVFLFIWFSPEGHGICLDHKPPLCALSRDKDPDCQGAGGILAGKK